MYPVVGKKKCVEAFEERQVAKSDNSIVSEINSIVLVLEVGLCEYIQKIGI